MSPLPKALVCAPICAALAVAAPAYACGPGFLPELFVDRAGTLADLPDGTFIVEAMQLLPKPADDFTVVEGDCGDQRCEPGDARSGGGERETALYGEGAKAYASHDWDKARARFLAVLALPRAERQRFSTFAAYMLGRTAAPAEAGVRFAEVRQLVRSGLADPLGLAVASYGEEARALLNGDDDVGAIRLYAAQAAHGSLSGAYSLLFVARAVTANDARLRRVLHDPLAQRLLATYAWTRGTETLGTGGHAVSSFLLDRLASVPALTGADRLAATAWRTGNFDLAARFAGKENTPLALWVSAKLSLRNGDRAAAEDLLGKAARQLEQLRAAEPGRRLGYARDSEEPWYDFKELSRRVHGDLAVLALARADFAAAMDRAVASCSYPDAAYLAERVLSTDELGRFLDGNRVRLAETCKPDETTVYPGNERRDGWRFSLQDLLARRLLRSGQPRSAMAMFDGRPNADVARQYAAALGRAQEAKTAPVEAEALFTAAQIARRNGLEILGTEVAPDWAFELGLYDMEDWIMRRRYAPAFGRKRDDDGSSSTKKALPEPVPFRAGFRASLTSAAERQRVASSAPPHLERFHYRGTAADLALQAAERLPRRSQAWAALLCHAARYVSLTEPARTEKLWRDYTRFGAVLPTSQFRFGQLCPQPQFERAMATAPARPWWPPWKKWRRRTKYGTLAGAALALAVATALLVRRARRA